METLPDVLRAAKPVLVRLMLISNAPVMRIGSVRGMNGAHESSRPPGESLPDAEHYARRLERASTVYEAREVLQEARTALFHAIRRPMAPGTTETLEEYIERIINDGAGWAVEDVARSLHTTPTFVRRVRLSAGRDPETGLVVPDIDAWTLAHALYAVGRSIRTISALTGIPRSTLHDRLSRRHG
jgi:transcriptional regulator of acetoin/glycerol metabolism